MVRVCWQELRHVRCKSSPAFNNNIGGDDINRQQRRNLKKPPKSKYSPEQIELAKILFLREQCRGRFAEGDKVKLNMEEIRSAPDWERKTPAYRAWCEAHAGQELTVIYDQAHTDRPELVCLEEDDAEPRWLFSVIDLMPAAGDDGFMDTINWVRASSRSGNQKK